MEEITRDQLQGRFKKGKPGKKRIVHEMRQYDKDQLLLHVRQKVPGSWEDVAKFWNSMHNVERRDAKYLEQRYKMLSRPPRKVRPIPWTPAEKGLLLRTVYDTVVLQYERAKENESAWSSELQRYQNEDTSKLSDFQPLGKGFAEDMQRQREETIKVFEKVLQPYLNDKPEKGGPGDLFVTVNEKGIETLEEPWICSTVQMSEQEIRARLKIVPMRAFDWEHIFKVWNEKEGRQKRTMASLKDMFSKLRKGQA